MASTFYLLNPFYNILNPAGINYASGAVAHQSTNFARTFGMITNVNNELVADPFPRTEIYPTSQLGIISNTSLTWGTYLPTNGSQPLGQQIYPIKYSVVIKQENQIVILLDKTSTKDLFPIFLQQSMSSPNNNKIYIEQSLMTSFGNDVPNNIVFVDDITGVVLVKTLTNYASETKLIVTYNTYVCSLTFQEILNLEIIPTDPVLPSGMPEALIYNKVVITGENQPININEFQLFENNINSLTGAYIKSIRDASGIYYNSLIKDGSSNNYTVIWGTDTLTSTQLATVVADSSGNPNTITLTSSGINYHKSSGLTGSFNFYSHAHGLNINNVKIGTIKGWSAQFTSTIGATRAPFFVIYTRPKGDGSDRAYWFNSRYVITGSPTDDRAIISGQLYTLTNALVLQSGSASRISTTAGFNDEILYVIIGSSSTDTSDWDIRVRSVDMVSDYVGGDLTIEYGNNHNLAITQNAIISSTYNKLGMRVAFYKDSSLVFRTQTTSGNTSNSYNIKFSVIDENQYTGTIIADVSINEILPFYSGWTKTIKNSVNNNISDNNIMTVTIQLSTLDTSSNIATVAQYPTGSPENLAVVDGYLYYNTRVADLGDIFTFSTNGTLNDASSNANDEVVVYASASKLFKNGGADAVYGVSSSAFPVGTTTTAPADTSYDVVNDYSSAAGGPYGKTAEKFIQNVAEKVFGSKLAVDLLLNEAAVAGAYQDSVNTCITSVNAKFAGLTSDASGAAQKIYDEMAVSSQRFTMMYSADLSGNVAPGTYTCTAHRTIDSSGTAIVTVVIDASGVSSMSVTTTGYDYEIGDFVEFVVDGVTIVKIVAINSVHAAMLNGTLSSQTPFPFETGDVLLIKFTLRTSAGQTNVAEESVSASIDVGVRIIVVPS